MTIKIICDGKLSETKIIDMASGVELQDDCTKVMVILDATKKFPELIMHFTDVALEVTGEVVKTFPPTGLTMDDIEGILMRR